MSSRAYDSFALRLHRDPERGLILGVCAGVAECFGWRPANVRLVALLALLFFTVPTGLVYLVAGLLLPRKRLTYCGPGERRLWTTRAGMRGRP